jgi:DNA polymerase IV (DinB-like DNA polymerase)
VEVQERSEFKRLPAVVDHILKEGRPGVVNRVSYEARKYGIHQAIPISQDYKLVQMQPFNLKTRTLCGILANDTEILKGLAESFQQVSVDVAYPVSRPEIKIFEDAAIYALMIRCFFDYPHIIAD